jgi:outer membrane receptor protein involved in Fe transport
MTWRHALLPTGRTGILLAWVAAALAPSPTRADEPPADPAIAPESEARDPGWLTKLSLEELTEIEVNAPAKVAQPVREAPSVGSVVTREQMDRYGWLSPNDIIFRQPGFVPAQDFERRTVAARGLYEGWNNNHLLMLVDGVPINNSSNGTAYTWDVFPLFMVERAEIFRGPGSALYGTNATNGVIALNTRKASNLKPFEARARFGNADTRYFDFFAGHEFPWVGITAGYYNFESEGNRYDSYDASGRTTATGELARFRVNDKRSNHFWYAKLEGAGPLSGLSLQVHFQKWSFETGHGWLYAVPDEIERAVNTEKRLWVTYRPRALLEERLTMEYVLLVQDHVKDYRIKFLPNGSTFAGIMYPGGVVEEVISQPTCLFARAQVQLRLWQEMTILAGVEDNLVYWRTDDHHIANVNLNRDGDFMPFPSGEFRPLRPVVEKIEGNPINNVGVYLQYATGRILGRTVSATLGGRYDLQSFDYHDVAQPGQPERRRSFSQLSPRVGLVFFPHEALTLKGMLERAFRAPSPSELIIVNSLLAASNTEGLNPEEITTMTLAADLAISRHLTLRADWFYTQFENQIAFSATQNLVANIYSRTLSGVEAEALFDADLGGAYHLGGFANFTFTQLLDEQVFEATIAPSEKLTWAPRYVANAGIDFGFKRLAASMQGHYQGRVQRRSSDRFTPEGMPTAFAAYRPTSVDPWFTLDARVSYRLDEWLRLGLQASNLFGTEGHLVKPQNFAFDFRIESRRVLFTVDIGAPISTE